MAALSARRRLLAYASGGFGLAMNAMILFLLPIRAAELGISIQVIGLLLAAKAAVEAVASVPLGGFMDRVGTRRAFLVGTGASTVIALGYYLASSAALLLVLQLALGLVRPLGWVGAQSYVAGLRSGVDRAQDTGRFSFSANVSQMVAPLVVGAVAQAFGPREAFLAFAAYSGVFFLVGLGLPDVGRHEFPKGKGKGSFVEAVALLRFPGIQVAMLLTFARLWVPSTWTAFFPLHLVQSGIPEGLAATGVSAMAGISTIVALFSGRIARLGRAESVTAASLAVASLGLAAAPFLAGVPWFYLSAALVGVGQGLSLPMLITIVSNRAPDGQRGLALGLRSSVNQVAAAIGPAVVASIIGAAGVVVGFPIAGGVAGLALLAAVARDRSQGATEGQPAASP